MTMRITLLLVCAFLSCYNIGAFQFKFPGLFNSVRSPLTNGNPSTSQPETLVSSSGLQSTTISKPSTTNGNAGMSAEFQQQLKLGVLFLNLGGPERQEDVWGFLYNLFVDPDIIQLPPLIAPFQPLIAWIIATRRSPQSSKAYASIGGGSPIVKYTREQSMLVQEELRRRGLSQTKCYFAMRYWYPLTEDVLQEIQEDGINTLVVVPLYPQFSVSTSGSSLKLLQDLFFQKPDVWGPEKVAHTVVPAWYHRPGYIKCMAKLIIDEIVQYSDSDMQEEGLHVLFSAHGVPESYITNGDPYQRQIEECVKLISHEVSKQLSSEEHRPASISAELGKQLAGKFHLTAVESNDDISSSNNSSSDDVEIKKGGIMQRAAQMFTQNDAAEATAGTTTTGTSSQPSSTVNDAVTTEGKAGKEVQFHLSYQSRVGPVQWLTPYTESMLQYLGEEKNVKNLIVVPVSFVSEHIETLEEIDMEYKEVAEEFGISNWRRVPALNTDPLFIEDMADLVQEALESPTLTVAEAASKSYSDMLQQTNSGTGFSMATDSYTNLYQSSVSGKIRPHNQRWYGFTGIPANTAAVVAGSDDDNDANSGQSTTSSNNPNMVFEEGLDLNALDTVNPSDLKLQLTDEAASKVKGTAATLSLMGTSLIEFINHHPVLQSMGFK